MRYSSLFIVVGMLIGLTPAKAGDRSGNTWSKPAAKTQRHETPKSPPFILNPAQEAGVLAVIGERTKDPEATRVRYLRAVRLSSGVTVCGEYNAKNGFGGYVGYRSFFVLVTNSGGMSVQLDPDSLDQIGINIYCNTIGLGKMPETTATQ